jgi:3-oxoacyl-[acyl-carrier protein] reductase
MGIKMTNRFDNQVAVVTGGARGIGRAIARRMAEEGAHVVLFDLREEEMMETSGELRGDGLEASCARVDITKEPEVSKAVKRVVRDQGKIDVMVNSAGIVGPTSRLTVDYSFQDFQQVVNVNLGGAFLMTKYCLSPMLERNYGRILLISSIGGKEGNPGMAGYAAAKSGVMGLVKGVGKEYAETGITVNGLAPAVIATPMNLDTDTQLLKYMADRIPMKRLGTVEEVAAISCWIVSREASFNTGFIFDLSGGRATF